MSAIAQKPRSCFTRFMPSEEAAEQLCLQIMGETPQASVQYWADYAPKTRWIRRWLVVVHL